MYHRHFFALTFTSPACQNERMQNIQIPDDQYARLTERAAAEGYADVTAFIVSLAGVQEPDPRGPLSEVDLQESVSQLNAAEAEIEVNGGRDAMEALLEIGQELGFKSPR